MKYVSNVHPYLLCFISILIEEKRLGALLQSFDNSLRHILRDSCKSMKMEILLCTLLLRVQLNVS